MYVYVHTHKCIYVCNVYTHIWHADAAAAAKSLQSCPTLCDPTDVSPLGSPIPGILQARTLSGLPFPSPMHEREMGKWSHSVVSDSSCPQGLQPTRLLHPQDFPGKSTGVGCQCLLCIYDILYNYTVVLNSKFYRFEERRDNATQA